MPLGVFPRQSAPPGAGGPPPPLNLPDDPALLPGYGSAPLLNQKPALLALTICFMTSAWLCSLLRLYVRSLVQRALGWDDFFLVFAMITTTMGSIVLCVMPDLGLGKPILYLLGNPDALTTALKTIYIGTATYPLSFMLIKLALLFQYLRAFEGKRTRQICKLMIGINAVSGIVFCAATWFSCWPVHEFWNPGSTGSSCWGFASRNHIEFMRITITQVVISVLLDIGVFLIPTWCFVTQRRDEHTSSKLSIFGLLILGFGALLCCIWRLAYVVEVREDQAKSGFDPTWDNPTVMGLASCEVHLAAICAAIPVFWPVVRETWNRIFVTYEVTVTRGYTEFPSSNKTNDVELLESQRDHWEPYVGDDSNGVGESETVVESLAGKRPRKPRDMLGHENGSNDTVTLNSRG